MAAKSGVGGEARQAAHSKRHKRAMKLCLYLLLVYIVSYAPLYLESMVDGRAWLFLIHLYYINHVGNFFIYLATDEKFRAEVKVIMRSLFRRNSDM